MTGHRLNSAQTSLLACCFVAIVSWAGLESDEGPVSLGVLDSPVEFQTDIMPIFSQYGCNAAECHGSATGQADFKLSLFGGDWKQDYRAVVNHLEGRRVNQSVPRKSLLLTKPTEELEHGGGQLFAFDSKAAETIRKWIQDGASDRAERTIESIELSQDKVNINEGQEFEVQVIANSSIDRRNVTAQTTFVSSNPINLEILGAGKFRVSKPGKYFLSATYLGRTRTITVTRSFQQKGVLIENQSDSNSIIDRALVRSANQLRINIPQNANGSVVIRRLFLDLVGRLPTIEEKKRFSELVETEGREQAVMQFADTLITSPEFDDHWTWWLRKALLFRTPGNDEVAATKLNEWLRSIVHADRPISQMANDLITTLGDSHLRPAASYHRFFQDARLQGEAVASSLLSLKIGCANCHNHPLDQWTQEDYHGLASLFATIKRGKQVVPLPGGTVIQPKTGREAIPRIPGVRDLDASDQQSRQQLADWIVESRRFRESFVNRVWKRLMGRGFVEPIDDLRVSNPAIDQELLTELSNQFQQDGFRLKKLVRRIVTSNAYTMKPIRSGPHQFLAGYYAKPISPEVLNDIAKDLLVPELRLPRATEVLPHDQNNTSLKLLTGCSAKECMDQEKEAEFGFREKLHLINGEFLNQWIDNNEGWIHKSLDSGTSSERILGVFYQRAFSRSWTDEEKAFWLKQVRQLGDDDSQYKLFLQDAIWSLLNSQEFRGVN